MAKLYFKYSTMNAGKSIDLLRINNNYIENGKHTLCFTSGKDDRYGVGKITSRVGISIDAISIFDDTNIIDYVINAKEKISCIFVDEAQFLKKEHIFELSKIVNDFDIPVITYGLRSDFTLEPFDGSKYLMAIADSIEEIKTICKICNDKKAVINARFNSSDQIETVGNQIQIGGNETYKAICRKCYSKLIKNKN